MTVTFLGEIAGQRSAVNDEGKRTYSVAFRLTSDAKTDTAYVVGSHASLPGIGSSHPDDPYAYCKSLSVVNSDPWKGWTVTAQYTNERSLDPADPDNDEVLISWSTEIYQEAIFFDYNGNAILNSVGDMFVDPPMRDFTHLIARISLNVKTVPTWVLSYQNAVNNSSITIGGLTIPIRTARFQGLLISERKYRGEVAYHEVSFEIHIHYDNWRYKPLDCGYRKIDYSTGKVVNITNEGDSRKPDEPVLLDGGGNVLTNPSPVTATYLDFQVYPELDFTVLPGIS